MKKILIITYHFPPDSEVGGLRVQKYAKYLPRFNWQPLVLTVKETYYPQKDYDRMRDVSCEVYRTKMLPGLRDTYLGGKKIAGRLLHPISGSTSPVSTESLVSALEKSEPGLRKFIIDFMWMLDDKTGWILPAVFHGFRVARRHSIDTILTTSPPHSVQITGLLLKLILRKRWVIDFRDPWSLILGDSIFARGERRLERLAMKYADTVCTATETVRDYLVKTHSDVPSDKFVCIPNGFDLEDFRDAKPEKNGHFVITYIGDLYAGRSPEVYLQAISELIREKKIDPERIRLKIIGKHIKYVGNKTIEDLLSSYDLNGLTDMMGAVPYGEAIRQMVSSQILVVLSPQNFVHPTKTFEYMASDAHILAFTPPGALADLVRRYPKGHVLSLDDVRGSKAVILECYRQHQNGMDSGSVRKIHPSSLLSEYDRKSLTKTLSAYL